MHSPEPRQVQLGKKDQDQSQQSQLATVLITSAPVMYMGLSENSVPLNPMVFADHYPY